MSKGFSLKGLISAVTALGMIFALTGCGGATVTNVPAYRSPKDISDIETKVVDENGNLSLEWNEEQSCALLRNKETGKIWSVPPAGLWEDGGGSSITSAIYIEYYNTVTGVLEEERASDCIDEGTVSVSVKDKVIRQEFYFDFAKVSIPVEYSLKDSALHFEIKASEIKEGSSVKLISISVLPYMASTPNTESKDSYLVTPVGSGAITYPIPELQNGSRILSLPVYGSDVAQQKVEYPDEDVKVNLPLFGVKSQNEALLGVISSGAESAELCIESGNIKTEHSTIYPKFTVHGYDRFEVKGQNYEDENVYNDKISLSQVYAVDYYPLSNEDANYSGMARKYRSDVLKLKNKEKAEEAYQLSFFGGAMAKSFFFGVPTQKFNVITDFGRTEEILNEIYNATGVIPEVGLYGYGKTGIDVGEIGGGFDFSSKLGGKKAALKLEEYCKEKGIDLYTDFQITAFTTSGSGFSTSKDVARSASLQYSYYYPLYKNLPRQNTSLTKIRCLKRDLLGEAGEKVIKLAKNRISGISFSDLGHTSYSDYRKEEYFVRDNIPEQVGSILKNVKDSGHKLSLSKANIYAALYADSVTEVPLSNGGYNIFDESIPFYQMVLRGSCGLYSEPVNLLSDSKNAVLNAVEFGVYPSFAVSGEINDDLIDTYSNLLYGSTYTREIKELIADTVGKTAELYKAVGNSSIVKHTRNGELSVTEYDNGVQVYVNYGDKAVDESGVTVEAQNFKVVNRKGE